jgi:CHAT domain-containing protein/tetratricopeptide (TPR) repeat protein
MLVAGPHSTDRAQAVRLRTAAIERLVSLADDSALVLYRAARTADPDYFPAQYEYVMLMQLRFRGPELRRELVADRSAPALHACLTAAAQQKTYGEAAPARMRALEARLGPSPCTDAFMLQWGVDYSPARAARALRDSPQLTEVWGALARHPGDAGQWRTPDQIFRAGQATIDNAIDRVDLTVRLISQRFGMGDTTGAVAIWQPLAAALRRDGRPGPLAAFLSELCTNSNALPVATTDSRAKGCREFNALMRTHRSWFAEWNMTRWLGTVLVNHGELTTALPVLARCVWLADSAGSAGLQLISYTQRGRAFLKLGQLSAALHDLRHAIALGPAAEEPYYVAEAYHNLAHTFEGAGRFTEAASAADSFASITAPMRGSGADWMSRHDAGMIRWEAGWHAAAKRDFEAMVRMVDDQHDGEYFAGEYFERVGDLGRALEHYRTGADQSRDPRNFAGLARVYEALGNADSAESVARQHDAQRDQWPILERPLLPDVLARKGRIDDAIALTTDWARHEMTSGSIEGSAITDLRLSDLLLTKGDARAAYIAATSADSLAAVLSLTVEEIGAQTLKGRALFAEGMRASGLTALRAAVELAREHPSTEALLSANLALGNALEADGQHTAALVAYDRASIAVERMTASLNEDADRTGFRSSHIAPFDGALRILLRDDASISDAEAALTWSARRKAAALALAGEPAGTTLSPVPIARMRGEVAPDEALVDFTMLDSTIAAIVVRREGVAKIRLHASPTQLAGWIQALRRPLVATPGGRIDLAHAPFDAAIAESLFHVLMAPLERTLAGVTRLAIVPDGTLWYVPFAALVTGRASDSSAVRGPRTYLIERYEIRLLPSASFLTAGHGGADLPAGFRVEALTYAVPGGAAELAAIRTALGSARVRTREGSAATERAALDVSVDVLHLAAHGVVDDRDALASHIQLAPDGRDDGLLHSSEVARGRLAARLVVLTACEGVSGKLYAGEGLVSLARAFLMSGARQVIASEWPVDASAVELTGVFYSELARGKSPSAALRAAQLALLKRPETAHPIHWAGFVAFDGGAGRRSPR